ncbi:PI-PLC domain-containing protein [Portibacter lacus]|nr:hypothetical protein [Portibacter lacus]
MGLRFLVLVLVLSSCRTTSPVSSNIISNASATIPAHAHNDYRNEQPLVEALSLGFKSIEVDIHLIDDELYVSHNTPFALKKEKTLEAMYLEPLSKADFIQDPLILLIDVKTDALETYDKLKEVLGQFKNERIEYVISGNRAIAQMLDDPSRLMSIDGRPEDIGEQFPSDYMPLISQNYNKFFSNRDPSKIDLKEKEAFQKLVNEVHQQGKIIRLWATPDHPEMWEYLKALGVDLINTDKIQEFANYNKSDF